jgi:hypothetical protein
MNNRSREERTGSKNLYNMGSSKVGDEVSRSNLNIH